MLKGIDILIDAIARLRSEGRHVTATLVGAGPDRDVLQAQVERLGLTDLIGFVGPLPAAQALTLGRIMVVPSRAESLPYVVLEAAAGGVPLVTTNVGGISEIYGPQSGALIPSDNVSALAQALVQTLDRPEAAADFARTLRERVATYFSIDAMVDGVLDGYRAALESLGQKARR
jgi:glycosyltransferase involved in cell wall biosynthesis